MADNIFDLGFNPDLSRGEDPAASEGVSFSGGLGSNATNDPVAPTSIASGVFTSIIYSGKEYFGDPAPGFRMGLDDPDGQYKFQIGDEGSQLDWNVTEDNQVSIVKYSGSTVGNALNIVDNSDDGNASLLVQFTGDNTSKELIRVELDSTMTNAKSGIAVDKEGGIAVNLIEADNVDGDINNCLYVRNQYSEGQVGFFHQDHASNQEPVVVVRADAPFNTNFYRTINLDGAATANLDIYIANNDDPNGTLSGGIGDMCISTDGKLYMCQGTTTWTDVSQGDDSYVYGDGSDGDLTISSGTTTLNTAGKYIYQYNSVSITGTGALVGGSNLQGYPIYIYVRGDLTITSSATPAVNWDALGSTGGAGGNPATTFGTGSNGGAGESGAAEWNGGVYPGGGPGKYDHTGAYSGGVSYFGTGGGGGGAWASGGSNGEYVSDAGSAGTGGVTSIFDGNTTPMRHIVAPYMGGGGGGGGAGTNNYPNGGTYGATGGAGGKGGGCIIFIVKGNINITGTIYARGGAGAVNVQTSSTPYVQSGAGGGGGGGFIGIYYSGSVTANTGTYTVTGGAGGSSLFGVRDGGAGGTGRSEVRYVPYLSIKL